jgi:hypothetical protein
VASIVIVTVPPLGMLPSQLTLLPGTSATAVPEVAFADTSVRVAGSVSTSSWPGLSAWVAVPVFASVIV